MLNLGKQQHWMAGSWSHKVATKLQAQTDQIIVLLVLFVSFRQKFSSCIAKTGAG